MTSQSYLLAEPTIDREPTMPAPIGTRATTVVFITGADRGIGLEVARKLSTPSLYEGYHVIIGSLQAEDGVDAAAKLTEEERSRSLSSVQIDVASDESISDAVSAIQGEFGRLDVLINNAGILLDGLDTIGLPRQLMEKTFAVNVFGAAAVTEAAIPLLQKSTLPSPRIVFMSSRMGSLSVKTDATDRAAMRHFPMYRSSKCALNMVMLHYAALFRDKGWKVNSCDPGLTATALAGDQKNMGTIEGKQWPVGREMLEGKQGPSPTKRGQYPGDGLVPDQYERCRDYLRKSKMQTATYTIPCTSCLDRGLEATCAREKVIVRKKQQRAPSIGETSSHGAATATGSLSLGSDLSGSPLTVESLCDGSSPDTFKSQHPSAAVPDDAPVTLENLALGRQRILNMQSLSATTTGDVGSGWLPAEVDFLKPRVDT
ncbi:short chain dehydrogenase [Seiridium cupressi]